MITIPRGLFVVASLFGLLEWCSASAAQPNPIAPKQFESLHKMVKAQPGENRFWEIPWRLDLWEARKMAAAQGKPILVWSGSGGPPITVC